MLGFGRRGGYRRSMPIKWVLAIGFGGLVAATVVGVYLTLSSGFTTVTGLLRERNHQIVNELISEIGFQLDPVARQCAFIARQIETSRIDPHDSDRLLDLLTGSLAAVPQVDSIGFVEAATLHSWRVEQQRGLAGDTVARSLELAPIPGMRERLEAIAAKGKGYWGDMIWNPVLRQSMLNYRQPIYADGKLIGYVTALVSMGRLSHFVGDDPSIFVLYGRDHVLANASLNARRFDLSSDRPLPTLAEIGDPVLAALWQPRTRQPLLLNGIFASGEGQIARVDGSYYVYVYRELNNYGETPWIVGRYFPLSDLGSELQALRMAALTGVIAIAVAVFISLRLSHRIGPPIRALAAMAARLRRFDFTGPEPPRSRLQELDEAARAFISLRQAIAMFATYVPSRLVNQVLHDGLRAMKSREREASIMFTDIVGFSALAEQMPPADIADLLNDHFTLLGEAIEAEQGIIDKYIGDAVMAEWNILEADPDHAAHALAAARRIAGALIRDNQRRKSKHLPPIHLRIGIHTGRLIAGNIGAPGRINFTVVGDSVNIAQRLEVLGRTVLTERDDIVVLASAETIAAAGNPADFVPIGDHQLPGRNEATTVFRLTVEPTEN